MEKTFKKINGIMLIMLLIVIQQVNAQIDKGAYFSLNTGYNMGIGGANLAAAYSFQIFNLNQQSTILETQEIAKVNLGQGLNVGLNGGYMFNKNIGLELGVNYLISSTSSTSITRYTGDYSYKDMSSKMLQIKPTVVFRASFDKINPYAKIGMVIGSAKMILENNKKDGADITQSTLELNKGIPIGFQGSLGILYRINDKFSLFGELDIISLSYAPEKGSYTKFVVNDVDVLPSMSVESKEIDFVDKTSTTGVPPSSTEPSKSPKIPFSYSSIGLNIGVQYHL